MWCTHGVSVARRLWMDQRKDFLRWKMLQRRLTNSRCDARDTRKGRLELIEAFTKVSEVEGVKMHLITEECELFHCRDEKELPFPSPWWAFCWPGGQGLTRFLRGCPELVKGKKVLDIGSGCGSASIVAALGGASQVVANDIDPFAGTVLELNSVLNRVENGRIHFLQEDKMGAPKSFYNQFDVVIVGDMLYDPDFSQILLESLQCHPCVIFGDPGRTYCPKDLSPEKLLASYDYSKDGFQSIQVFQLNPSQRDTL